MDKMKKIVTYQIRGHIERNCSFKVGKAVLRIDFTGGSISSYGIVPAQYITGNTLYQHAIESSEQFARGEITKASELLVEEKETPVDDAEKEKEEKTAFTEVTNMQQARNVLMQEPLSVPLSELQTKTAIKTKALELGISFPCWN